MTASAAVLAIDYGTKRLGVAVTDRERGFVFPRDTILRTDQASDLAALGALAREDEVSEIALGLPLSADGTEGPMAAVVRKFGALLHAELGLPVRLVDERYSSLEAEERLREMHPRDHRRRKALRDRGAAVIILRTFLDHGPYE